MNKRVVTRNITQIAVFSALSIVLYMVVKFPLPFLFAPWLELQISDMPALLAGFMMGPWQGASVLAIKTLVKLPFSSTACVGELADLIIGLAFVLPSSYFYKNNKTRKGARIALIIGCVLTTFMSIIANYIILVPFYVQLFVGGDWNKLVNMLTSLFPSVTLDTFYLYYLLLSVLPFNILRSSLCATITFFLYKQLRKLFDMIFGKEKVETQAEEKFICEVETDEKNLTQSGEEQ